ncbi:MAG: GrpB family protein [Candidatus Cloacimonetes bacterium]|nr:GrpB family protein [Candidatus Cloacimonadota bacterium]
MIGLENNIVKLSEYKPIWKSLFDDEKTSLNKIANGLDIAVEHIGSTAVPGLCAKPIIDILIGIDSFYKLESYIDILCNLGYKFKGENGVPGRYFFVKSENRITTHHAHMVIRNSALWYKYIIFRNCLIINREIQDQYAALKRELAEKFQFDRPTYTEAKTAFIHSTLQKADEIIC